jgi:hypothetical protein
MTDLAAAREFVQLHSRLVDRRRFDLLFDDSPVDAVAAAVRAYANPDGGFAGVIEPDVRTTSSQPIAVLTAFEILNEAGAPADAAALDWLQSITGPDGGIPFSLPTVDDAPRAPWMAPPEGPSLHMTAAIAAAALRGGVSHPWIDAASAYCRDRIAALDGSSAYETKFAIDFLDATDDTAGVERVRDLIPPDGLLPVRGGVEGETLTALDLAPAPGSPARALFTDAQISRALDDLEDGQRDDGGWDIDFLKWSPVVATEWRGRRTVDALALLKRNGRQVA